MALVGVRLQRAAVVPHLLIIAAPRVQWGSISCAIYAAGRRDLPRKLRINFV